MRTLIPENLTVSESEGKTVLRYRRAKALSLITILFLIGFIGVTVRMPLRMSVTDILMRIPFILIPLYMFYVVVKRGLNVVTITIAGDDVKVFHFPFCSTLTLRRSEISYVFLKSKTESSDNNSTEFYSLCFATTESREIVFLEDMEDLVHAQAIRSLLKEKLETSVEERIPGEV